MSSEKPDLVLSTLTHGPAQTRLALAIVVVILIVYVSIIEHDLG